MHEMSIVTSILNIVEDQARSAGAEIINSIELEIGTLAGIEVDSLEFCFQAARQGTMAADAELVILEIPGRGHCPECRHDVDLDHPLAPCPDCGQAVIEAHQGRELRIKSINVD